MPGTFFTYILFGICVQISNIIYLTYLTKR